MKHIKNSTLDDLLKKHKLDMTMNMVRYDKDYYDHSIFHTTDNQWSWQHNQIGCEVVIRDRLSGEVVIKQLFTGFPDDNEISGYIKHYLRIKKLSSLI